MLGLGTGLVTADFTRKKETYTNTHAVAKALTTGASHYIGSVIPANSVLNFTEDDALTISFWIKVGWDVNLNTSVFMFSMGPSDASTVWDNHIRIYYNESYNRIIFSMMNNPGDENKKIMAEWLFHSNSSEYAPAWAAAGLGGTYWNSSNRGNVGDGDFTLITITKSTTASNEGCTLYWNATTCNAADGLPPSAINTSEVDPGNLGMISTEEKLLAIGANVNNTTNRYTASGNNAETQYNDFAIWNKALTAAEVAAIYNSGTPMDLGVDSGDYASSANLQLYYKFENNGEASEDGALSDGLDLTVAGDSNFESL